MSTLARLKNLLSSSKSIPDYSEYPFIVSAAVKYPKLLYGDDLIVMSVRHYDDICDVILSTLDRTQNNIVDRADTHKDEEFRPIQGFVGSDQVFYTRKEAYDIVMKTRQPLTEQFNRGLEELFSEDLYL